MKSESCNGCEKNPQILQKMNFLCLVVVSVFSESSNFERDQTFERSNFDRDQTFERSNLVRNFDRKKQKLCDIIKKSILKKVLKFF